MDGRKHRDEHINRALTALAVKNFPTDRICQNYQVGTSLCKFNNESITHFDQTVHFREQFCRQGSIFLHIDSCMFNVPAKRIVLQ